MERAVVETAFRIFRKEGVQGHAPDELIARLGLTPAAFVAHFQNMEGLLKSVAQLDLEMQEGEIEALLPQAENAAEEVTTLLLLGLDRLRKYHPEYFLQLKRDYPAIWAIYSAHTQHYTYHKVLEVLNRGVLSQIFRRDINLELVTKIVIAQLNMLFNASLFPPARYNLVEVFRSIFLYYTRGICTEQGAKLAEAYFSRISL